MQLPWYAVNSEFSMLRGCGRLLNALACCGIINSLEFQTVLNALMKIPSILYLIEYFEYFLIRLCQFDEHWKLKVHLKVS